MARKAKAPKKKPAAKKSKGGPSMSKAGIPIKAANWKATALAGKPPTIGVNFEDGSVFEMRGIDAVMALTMLQRGPCYKMTNPNGLCSYSGAYGAQAKSTA